MKKKVSVIIPIYNTEQYLRRCIESVINQTYEYLEIILVDDGSLDSSLGICESFLKLDDRIIIVSQPNQGVSSARNRGIQVSSGDYVFFLDSDDEILSNTIESMIDVAESNNVDLVLDLSFTKEILKDTKFKIYDTDYSMTIAMENIDQSACGRLIKKEFLGDICFEENKSVNEDSFFMFQVYLKRPRIARINGKMYVVNKREDSASRSSFSLKYLDMLYFLEKKKALVNSKCPEYHKYICVLEMRTRLLFLRVLSRDDSNEHDKLANESIRYVRKNVFRVSKTTYSKQERRDIYLFLLGGVNLYRTILNLKKRSRGLF